MTDRKWMRISSILTGLLSYIKTGGAGRGGVEVSATVRCLKAYVFVIGLGRGGYNVYK